MKTCTKCGEEKPLDEFPTKPGRKGYRAQCKVCRNAYMRNYYSLNKEMHKARVYSNPNRLAHRRVSQAKRYGFSSSEELEAFRSSQPTTCPICLIRDAVCIDHDHESGRVRGLLCSPCNFLLGHAYDDLDTLRRAIEYLEQ